MSTTRPDGRTSHELREITFERDFTEMSAGSVLVSFGRTRVLCTASIDEDVPRWMKGSGKGWVTAEYSMLPGSSNERVDREAAKGKQSGRTVEIQRLIGRSLRASCDMSLLGERQVVVDCDVLQADGGTRTASICGGYLALHDALTRAMQTGSITHHPLTSLCAAISVGIVGGVPVIDLPYIEDSGAEVDMNIVMLRDKSTQSSRFVEVQGTAEGMAFTRGELDSLLGLAEEGLGQIFDLQREILSHGPGATPEMTNLVDTPIRELVCASANPDKVREIEQLLDGVVTLHPRPSDIPDVEETENTLVGNARLRARAIADSPLNVSGLPAVADDTGLFVDALPGELGVLTARYASDDPLHASDPYGANRRKLLASLFATGCVEPASRTAHFTTVVVVAFPDGGEMVVEGRCDGIIAPREAGSRGFGFDPLFVPTPGMFDGDMRTFAEMTGDEKNALSHRGRAFRALARALGVSPTA